MFLKCGSRNPGLELCAKLRAKGTEVSSKLAPSALIPRTDLADMDHQGTCITRNQPDPTLSYRCSSVMRGRETRVVRRCVRFTLVIAFMLLIFRPRVQMPSVAIVALCQLSQPDHDQFAHALKRWFEVRGVSEIIIVDWDSQLPIVEMVSEVLKHSLNGPHVNVIETSFASLLSWRISVAFNIGLDHVHSDVVLKLDSDTLLAPGFLEENMLHPGTFRRASWRHARDENELHLNGVFMAQTSHLRTVHGMDERISMYGWDDDNLYERLQNHLQRSRTLWMYSCLVCDLVRYRRLTGISLISHLEHSRRNGNVHEKWATCFNRMATKYAPSWNGRNRVAMICEYANRHDNLTTRCMGSGKPPTLGKTIGRERCEEIARQCEGEEKMKPDKMILATACGYSDIRDAS